MTDISDWPTLIHRAGVLHKYIDGVQSGYWNYYTMIPLNEYQMGNLLDALSQANENGDWYGELCDIIAVAMKKSNIKELTSNSGKVFTYEKVKNRDLS